MNLQVGYNAYNTIEYFNDNITNPESKVIWDSYTDLQKENYIIYVTRLFDSFGWIGFRSENIQQNLAFPRMYTHYICLNAFYNSESRNIINGGYCETEHERFLDLTIENQKFMITTESQVTKDITIIPVLILEVILELSGNKALENLQNSGVKSFEAGSLSFDFKDKISIDKITKIIQDSKMWYLTEKFWSSNQYLERV